MNREDAISWLNDMKNIAENWSQEVAINMAIKSLSADPKWITDSKPTEEGTYMVTLDAFNQHRFIDLMHYGKPLMPNRKFKGKCWYRADAEWGDIVYDDEDILAWLPLPTPYEESEVEE